MSLLSNTDKTNIRAALKLVTDTFFVSAITYKRAGESVDRFNEDRGDMSYTTLNLSGLVEYKGAGSDWSVEGGLDKENIKVSLNIEDLIAIGGIVDGTTKMVNFNQNKDYMTVAGVSYKLLKVYYDGPLDAQNILVILEGVKEEKSS